MVDHTKISLLFINIRKLIKKFDDWETVYKGKKVKEYRIKFNHCVISIKGGYVEFTGSLHKFYNALNGIKSPIHQIIKNDNGYNGNRFTHSNLLEVGFYLCELFECDFYQMKLLTVEFGVNLETLFKPRLFIKGLLFHYGLPFEFKHRRGFAVVQHTESKIKIYDKAGQYKLLSNLLRFELYLKRRKLNKIGVDTFADLLDKEVLNVVKNEMINELYSLVYYDYTIDQKPLKKTLKGRLNNYQNQNYWLDDVAKNHRDRPKQELTTFIANHSKNLRLQIENAITKECVIIQGN